MFESFFIWNPAEPFFPYVSTPAAAYKQPKPAAFYMDGMDSIYTQKNIPAL